MLEIFLKLFVVLLLVIANGFFVAVEFALVSVRRSRIESLAAAGKMGARSVLHALDHLDAMLSASQFGITLASLALGAVGESTLSHMLEPVFERMMPATVAPWVAHSIAVAIALGVITYLHLVLGEYAPKAFAIEKAEAFSMATARSLDIFYRMFKPFIWLINVSGIKLLRLFGVNFRPGHHAAYTEDEIRYLIKTSHESGHLHSDEKELIYNVFDFADLTARKVMIPRTEITALEDTANFEEVIKEFQASGYSRLPVYHETFDDIVGILHGKDVMPFLLNKKPQLFDLTKVMRQPVFIPDTMKLGDVLHLMKRDRVHLAVVIDEHSGVEGILTLEDLLEELVGDIEDEHDDAKAESVKPVDDQLFSLAGSMSVREANRKHNLNLPETSDFTTVAGFLLWRAGKMLVVGDVVEYEQLRFTIERVIRRRIERVKIERTPPASDEDELNMIDL